MKVNEIVFMYTGKPLPFCTFDPIPIFNEPQKKYFNFSNVRKVLFSSFQADKYIRLDSQSKKKEKIINFLSIFMLLLYFANKTLFLVSYLLKAEFFFYF